MYYLFFIIKTLYNTLIFNLRYFKLINGLKFPVLVSGHCKLQKLKGTVVLHESSFFGIRIGFGDVGIFDKYQSRTLFRLNGRLEFYGKANIGHGSRLSVDGRLVLGKNFKISAESAIICESEIVFGDNCLVSWECLFLDSDFHPIFDIKSNLQINFPKKIYIGDNVWICSRCTILKGTQLLSNSVAGAGSVINRKFPENCIIAGNPAVKIRDNIYWSK